MNTRILAIVAFFVEIIVWIVFLIMKQFDQTHFLVAFAISIICLILVYDIESISKISLKFKGVELLAEVNKVREDIYAKVEIVRTMGEQIAALSAYTLAHQNKWRS